MLELNQSSLNQRSLPLKQTATGKNHLFEFKSSTASKFVIAVGISENDRSTAFTIDLRTNDPTNGGVLIDTKDYNLYIYEQTSSTNLDPSLSDGLVWSGRAVVNGVTSTDTYETTISDTIVYGGS